MPATTCLTCANPRRGEIDDALHAGNSFRAVALRFGLTKDAITRHAKLHVGITDTSPKARRAARRRVMRNISQAGHDALRPKLDTIDDFRAELTRLYHACLARLDAAEAAGDARLAEKEGSNALAILQQHGRSIGAFQADNVVHIDRSEKRVVNIIAGMSDEDLRGYLRGERTIALPETSTYENGGEAS